jgi:hypothetical protein
MSAPRTQPGTETLRNKLIGCGGAILTSSLVIIPTLVAAYYLILKPILAAP